MHPPLIFGPIPPYSNPPIEPQFYKPSQFFISNITLGQTTTVTTTVNHNYVIGQQVRLLIPGGFGSKGLNEQTGFVLSIPAANQVVLDIFSIGMDPFINATFNTKPQIVAIGDDNSGVINSNGRNATATFIPGSFIDIS
jgi:hypothetical protein